MASHLFMKLLDDKGQLIKGEAQFKDYDDNWIELEGYSWSMEERTELQGTVAGQKPNYAKPGMFGFSKFPDASTNKMLQLQVGRDNENKRIKCQSAEFHVFEELQGTDRDTGGVFKLIITLTDVVISRYKLKADSSDKAVEMKEEWEFDYGDINFNHKNAGANVKIEKPEDPDDTKLKGDAPGGGGATNVPGGGSAAGDAVGLRDFLSPLGSL